MPLVEIVENEVFPVLHLYLKDDHWSMKSHHHLINWEEIPQFMIDDFLKSKEKFQEAQDTIRAYLKTGLH